MIVAHENYYGLYTHNGRSYNLIMAFDQETQTFSFSIPGYKTSWPLSARPPEKVLSEYRKSEMRGLYNYWKSQECELIQ